MIEVIKSTGQKEEFNKEKLCRSIKASGAPEDIAERVCSMAAQKITSETTTARIFRSALNYLVKEDIGLAANYGLRRAVNALGPAGFLFEQYVEAILQSYDYKTERNIIMKGFCVEHEIDVSAKKDGTHYLIEAKYRNESGIKTHIDTVMYGDARLADIARQEETSGKDPGDSHKLWLFTNTKFTEKAVRYAKCRNIMLTGWSYPPGNSLEDMISAKKIYPVTVLPSLSRFAREQFAQKGVMLAQDILPYEPESLSNEYGIASKESSRLVSEARELANWS